MQRSLLGDRYLYRKAVVSLFAVGTLAGQVAIIERVPEPLERVACWAMSLMWIGGTALMIRLARSRPVFHQGSQYPVAPPRPVIEEEDREPSGRMRVAWCMARAGSDTELVAHIAQVPYALAELIVADARPGADGER